MKCDAIWLKDALARLPPEDISPIVNLGSSTAQFREVEQPFINELIFAPLAAAGVEVIHSDLKMAPGVDIACDIFDDEGLAKIRERRPKAVICTHMLEHVVDREDLVRRLLSLLPEGGYFFVTVPSSYHQHNDPIDTMYRPSPDELATLFAGQTILEKQSLVGETYWSHIKKRPVTLFFRHFFRFWFPFFGWRQWRRSMGKLYWLFNHYTVATVLGRKAVDAPARMAPSGPRIDATAA